MESNEVIHKTMPKVSPRINLRTPEVMLAVQAKVEQHYRSSLVEKIKAEGGLFSAGKTTIRLAKQFGFCYGVERAIDLAYAARNVFPQARLFLMGEIIHNPEVNAHMAALGIKNLFRKDGSFDLDTLNEEDVVILPAFGAEVAMLEKISEHGCRIVDTTCGDVMSVWKRVKQNATEEVTSIIHGKASHEETRATASRALGMGKGHYLIVLNLEETNRVCRYVREGGDRDAFLKYFEKAISPGFDPELHLKRLGVANQTTMLRAETEEVQRRLREAIEARDGNSSNFRFFDTICGATQERQEALVALIQEPLDVLLVVGGYNSSNTTHLAEMGEKKLPTYFIRNQECLESLTRLRHFDLQRHEEIISEKEWMGRPVSEPLLIGITAGASCPNNLIEEVMKRVLSLRGEESHFKNDAPS
jgi:4-hydroxy-3-methylbut-2-enyl diphosphate reductase